MINDSIKTTGEVTIMLRDGNGNIKVQRTVPNLVVTTGKNVIASRLAGTTSAVMSHMALGTNSSGVVAGNTALGSEIVASSTALTSTTVVDNVITYIATFIAGAGTGAVVEAGIFNAASAGSMLCRTVFAVVNKDPADSLTISWAVTIA